MPTPLCEPATAWPASRFPASRPDWIFGADGGTASSWAAQFRLTPGPPTAGKNVVHLVNRLSGGCVNMPSPNVVRGHESSSPRARAAPPSATTELRWSEVESGRAQRATASAACKAPTRLRFEFIGSSSLQRALSVSSDGELVAIATRECGDHGACDFDLLRLPPTRAADGAHQQWYGLQSVLTGRLLRLFHSEMPEVPSWLGIHPPRARPKMHSAARASAAPGVRPRPRSAIEMAAGGAQQCPLLRKPDGTPSGWVYNATLWAPLIDAYLAPWREGNVSATMLDLAFWRTIYGEERQHAIPGIHVSVAAGRLHARENVDYRMKLFRDMMRTVSRVVRLPDVEFVTHLWDHPKVDRPTPLPVFAHYADAAHRDVPIPAPWSWDEQAHSFPQPWIKVRGCARPFAERNAALYFRGGCNGPTRGWRGPLWRFYPRKRANRLSMAAGDGEINAGTYDHCDSPKLSKLEWGWDQEMEREMFRSGVKKKIEPFKNNCNFKYLLHVDGNVASSRLASELHVGSVIFKQDSFSSEYFYPLLTPYVHYVPVAVNLEDVEQKLRWVKAHPRKARRIADEGRRFAKEHLHVGSISCYWWQLLSAFAELQNFVPRTDGSLGFRAM